MRQVLLSCVLSCPRITVRHLGLWGEGYFSKDLHETRRLIKSVLSAKLLESEDVDFIVLVTYRFLRCNAPA